MPTPKHTSSFTILIIACALTVIGFGLIPKLIIKYLPTVQRPQIQVQSTWRDATPAIIERDITSPLEASLALLSGVDKMKSISKNGTSTIYLELEKEVDTDLLRFEASNRIRQIYPSLPEGCSYPKLSISTGEKDETESPILTYSISGPTSASELYVFSRDELIPQLSFTEGLDRIDLVGANANEWIIELDPALLRKYKITIESIVNILRSTWEAMPLGNTWKGNQYYPILIGGQNAVSKQEILDLAIPNTGNQIIILKNLGTVKLQEQTPQNFYRINSKNSIRLLFYLNRDANAIVTAKAIKKAVGNLTKSLPQGYTFYLDQDQSEFLKIELNKIAKRSGLSLVLLFLFVLIAYRNWKHLAILLFSLLVNLGLAAIAYFFFEVELNLYALAGITVTFGIIMDNVIVMSHHILKQRNKKVFSALVASTLTTICALIIVFFLPELWKARLSEFAKVIMINLSISLAVSWWVVPALIEKLKMKNDVDPTLGPDILEQSEKTSWYISKRSGEIVQGKMTTKKNTGFLSQKRRSLKLGYWYQRLLENILKFRLVSIILVILAFGLPVFLLPNQVQGWEWYNKSLGDDYYVENIKPVVNRALGGTLRLFMWYVYDGASYRSEEETQLYVNARMQEGATKQQMNAAIGQVEKYLAQFPTEIKQYIATVSSGQNGRIVIKFNAGFDGSFPHILKARITSYCTNMGGISWNVYGVGRAFSNSSGSSPPRFKVAMKGFNKENLLQQAALMSDSLLSHPRIQEVNVEANIDWWSRDRYEYYMELDKRSLAELSIHPYKLRPIFEEFNQFEQRHLSAPGNVPVRLVMNNSKEHDLWALNNKSFPIDSHRVSLGSLGEVTKRKATQAIHKEDQQYIRMVEFEYTGSAHFGGKYLDQVIGYMQQVMPMGYSIDRRQYSFWSKEEKQKVWLLLMVMGFIFFICSIHFESFKQALAILVLIPTSFIGIFLTFYLFDFSFDQGGYTSFILLSGLVVNSLILIISDYNRFCRRFPFRSPLRNYIKAFQHKITPIILTVLSTALGLIPFLLGGDQEVFWFALAAGTIGGLIFSLVVIFLFIPVFVVRRK